MPIPQFKYSRSWRDKNFKNTKISNSPKRSAGFKFPKKLPSLRQLFSKEKIKYLMPYFLIAASFCILFFLFLIAWYSRDLPRPDKIIDRSIAQSTKIYDRTGEHLLFEAFDTQRRTIIPLEEIPEYVKWGTILVEDKKFYEHGGFDIKGIARAIIKDILSLSKDQGGSTLTQQLIKNALLSNEKAWSRKIKELVLSYQIERKFSKDQILQMYFNEIPYGSSAYGIESASQFYFGKSAKDLTIAEGATLSALPQAPTYYSPYGSNKDKLIGRKNYIINLLKEDGKITQEQAEEAKNAELNFLEKKNTIKAPHFVIWVREQLAKKYGEQKVEQGGLKIITTIDYEMQKAAEEAIEYYSQSNIEKYNATNAALVAIDPKTGEILAMVGSRDYFSKDIDGNFNVVTQGKRQPGSSLKPFVYAVGLEKGYTDKTTLWDVVTNFGAGGDGKEYTPKNYDSKERGPVSVRSALQLSLNIPAVKMLYLVGANSVIKRAQDFGYTTFENPERYGLSLVLGGAEVRLIEHTRAYAAFANNGILRKTLSILKVEDSSKNILEENKPDEGQKVMDENIAKMLTNILSDNGARAAIFGESNYLTLGDRPVAAKTGTTNDYRDAWLMGYVPSLASGVWVGNNNFSEMKRGAGGSTVAAPIWNRFMKNALANKKIEYFENPVFEYPDKDILKGSLENGSIIKIDKASGLLATDMTPESFIEEKVFKIGHNILHYVLPKDPTGQEPKEGERDWAYQRWEEPVQKWMEKNGWKVEEGVIPEEYDNLHVYSNKPSITILDPKEEETINQEVYFFKAEANAPRGISRIEFYVDGKLASESRTYPYVGRFVAGDEFANGYHTLKAIAYDDIDNSEQVSVDFNLLVKKENLNIEWISPKQNKAYGKNDFPFLIKIKTPNNVSKVEIFAEPKNEPGKYILIKSVSGQTGEIETYWNSPPEISGEWKIYAILWKENTASKSQGPTIEIKF